MSKYLIIYKKRKSSNYTKFYRLIRRLEKQGLIRRAIAGIETGSKIIANQLEKEAKEHFEQVEILEVNK